MSVKIKAKEVWEKHKVKIMVGASAIGLGVLLTVLSKDEIKAASITEGSEDTHDYGKDLEMHFIDPENGEILWKERCTEEYMNDLKEYGDMCSEEKA